MKNIFSWLISNKVEILKLSPVIVMLLSVSLYWPVFFFDGNGEIATLITYFNSKLPYFNIWIVPVFAVITDCLALLVISALIGLSEVRAPVFRTFLASAAGLSIVAVMTAVFHVALMYVQPDYIQLSHSTKPEMLGAIAFVTFMYLSLSVCKVQLQAGCMFLASRLIAPVYDSFYADVMGMPHKKYF